MKLIHITPLPVAAFLISLLFSTVIVQSKTQILTETRKSALAKNLSQARFERGSHLPFFILEGEAEDAYSTARILHILRVLDKLDAVDLEKGLNYIISTQNLTIGNLTLWGWPAPFYNWAYLNELYVPCVITDSIKLLGAINRLNRTALVDVVLARYNESDGALHEPLIKVMTEQGERQYALCGFPLEFHATSDVAYANSNMISTFLGVSILANLNSLNMINTTKTLNWILSCKAENGAFKPFPESRPEYLPGWSSLRTNPFYVDRYGTGIAYTYAALGALKALGVNIEDAVDIDKVREYVLSCQVPYPRDSVVFLAHPDDSHGSYFASTYYAIMTLYYIGAFENETEVSSKVTAYILRWLQDDYLSFTDSWSVPSRDGRWYGLFVDFPPLDTTYFAVDILNVTNSLSVLDQLTPVVSKTWFNLITLSVIASISTTGLAALTLLTYKRLQAWRQKRKSTEIQPPMSLFHMLPFTAFKRQH